MRACFDENIPESVVVSRGTVEVDSSEEDVEDEEGADERKGNEDMDKIEDEEGCSSDMDIPS